MSSFHWIVVSPRGRGRFRVWAQETKLKYPETKKGDVVDDYHGTKVADPYRWLEDDVRKSKDVAEWVEAENKVTFGFLESHPRARGDQEAHHRPVELREDLRPVEGRRPVLLLQERRPPEPERAVRAGLARRRAEDAHRPEHLEQGRHRRAVAGSAVSDDAKYIAYGVAEAGSDWNTWKVLDVAARQDARRRTEVGEVQRRVVDEGRQGLLLQPLPRAEEGRRVPGPERGHEALLPQARHAAERGQARLRAAGQPEVERRRRASPRTASTSSSPSATAPPAARSAIAYKDLSDPATQGRSTSSTTTTTSSTSSATTAACSTSRPTTTRRSTRSSRSTPQNPDKKNWKTIIPEAKEVLDSVDLVGNRFICSYLKDAKTAVKVHEVDGKFVRDVELPGIGTATRLRRQAHRHRDLLHLLQLRHADEHLPLRHRDRREQAAPAGEGEVRSRPSTR